jgi:hypothetical protein
LDAAGGWAGGDDHIAFDRHGFASSAQPEEGQDGQDHDDKADEIDDAVHFCGNSVTQFGESQRREAAFWLRVPPNCCARCTEPPEAS